MSASTESSVFTSRNPAQPEPIISVQDLVVRYGGNTILHGINLDVLPGETMVILGGSGSGKSTMLRHIEALAKPVSGRIFVKGVDVTRASEKELFEIRRIMGVSFQSAAMV